MSKRLVFTVETDISVPKFGQALISKAVLENIVTDDNTGILNKELSELLIKFLIIPGEVN